MTTTSATSSATASIVKTLGGGSGIDMTALARDLSVAQFAARADRLTARSETLDRQISAASNLKSMLLNLSTSLGERVRAGDLSPQPQVANAAVAQASLSGVARPSGSFALEVTALAAAQTLASPPFAASTSAAGAGTLTLRFGTVSGASFAEDAGHAAVNITVPSGATLADVASAITASGAGVTAYVANTVDGAKLVLKGQDGAANGFVLEAAETPGEPGLSQLAWEPVAGDPLRLKASASDAAFKLDGLAMSAKGNSVTDAVPGLNLKLTATNIGAPTQITFSDPRAAITSAMQDLTGALNEIMAELNAATNPQGGDLSRDSGALALKRTMSQLAGTVVMPGAPEGTPRTLSDLGLKTQRDGTLAFDSARLAATLQANPDAAAAMFTNGLYGVYATIDGVARGASSAGDAASLTGSVSRYSAQKLRLTEDQTKIADQQEALRARLTTRFAAADTRIGVSKSTLSFIQNQIAAWNKSD